MRMKGRGLGARQWRWEQEDSAEPQADPSRGPVHHPLKGQASEQPAQVRLWN